MSMKDSLLYVLTIIIWGSTWIGIKFQLGTVDPMVSVVYRFALSSVILLVFCRLRGLSLKFSFKDHGFMALLGLLLFSVNYWLVYVAEVYLTSGLVAVLFSSIVFLNIANGALFLGAPVERKMVVGAAVGIVGIGLIFMHEIESFDLTDKNLLGIAFGFSSVLLASLGNITSARNSRADIPVIQANAFGMGYGALALAILAISLGKSFDFSMTLPYVGSLFYLAVFGSIIAFTSYLTLIRSLGADKASYSIMVVPVVALIISSFAEGYIWSVSAIAGLILVVGGNFLALHRPSPTA
ncbi:DMT family transporter [Desulfotignum phosphitoxidans]|uniref:EamA-like transporter family n=1 Tax=Desulfotignum phosphitoxidans DSM 13687 TaxID=1286635 RepID=S0G535_9BACT|nr:EamA family transporter [Desulfotignum phosphitoxidans]EMS79572.1 EamA-like transporter family [Desulfotignum phosphitoxidans DSM 13687]